MKLQEVAHKANVRKSITVQSSLYLNISTIRNISHIVFHIFFKLVQAPWKQHTVNVTRPAIVLNRLSEYLSYIPILLRLLL